ncbi:hypothetical protein A2688_00065, partial [Candidatus Daviesbacteria bacterium RIFCSPHIGHO2_01_FULL_38_8]
LHIHSRFSRACSQEINIPNLSKWAKFKGIDLIGTGDFLHPMWFAELKKYLKEGASGIHDFEGTKFLLTNEISCIYSDKGKTRRIHIVVLMPSFDSVDRLQKEFLGRKINISSDGRPIVGLSAKELCEMIWSIEKKAVIIPAHIWTPWFSLYGSESGYDFFKECFEELSDKIFAIETGLSSEPAMNWRIADLDNKSIVSFSDAHSLPKIGREVTIFKGNLSYDELVDDLKKQNLVGTIEFFPEEGKYHYSGHRNCGVVYSAEELSKKGDICPVCKKRLTVGVMTRVQDLAVRTEKDLKLINENGVIKSQAFPERPGFRMLVQLQEIIAQALSTSVGTQKVKAIYEKLVTNVDTELKILTKTPLDLISMVAGEKIAEGIDQVRQGKLTIKPGYDNTYGVVKIWDENEEEESARKQVGLFS